MRLFSLLWLLFQSPLPVSFLFILSFTSFPFPIVFPRLVLVISRFVLLAFVIPILCSMCLRHFEANYVRVCSQNLDCLWWSMSTFIGRDRGSCTRIVERVHDRIFIN